MDDDFPTSPSKRRRTMSPEEAIPNEPIQSHMKPEPAYQPTNPDPAVREEVERKIAAENNFLEVLMQQVEAQSSTGQEPAAVTTAPTNGRAMDANEPTVSTQPEVHEQSETRIEQDGALQTNSPNQTSTSDTQTNTAANATMIDAGEPPTELPVEREWETDSSPYDSDTSSEDTSSEDDSDDDEDDEDGEYAMLNPEEAARILMQDDGGSDDEGKSKDNSNTCLRTAHEQAEEVIPKPDIIVSENTPIVELGNVEFIVENTVLIKAKTSGEYQVLESGSALCLKDRSVIGAVAETIGRVEEPMYTVRFTNGEAIKEAGVADKGTTVYYVVPHSTFVFTQPLKAFKGSDASNFHDEEVGAEEMEFSDDEKEAEHKRQLKLKKQGRKDDGGRGARGRGRGGLQHPGRMQTVPELSSNVTTLDYDDNGEGYTPLTRPTNLHEMMSGTEPGEVSEPLRSHHNPRGGFQNPRGARPRGRGNFRGGRGGSESNARGGRGGFSHPHPHHNNQFFSQQPTLQHSQPQQQQQQQAPPFPFPPGQYPPFQGQPPSAPHLNAQRQGPTHANSHNSNLYSSLPFSPSPISPFPHTAFNFPPQQPFPPFGNMQPPPVLPSGGFSFGQPQPQPQHLNQAAFAQVQRQLAEMHRMTQQQQGQGGGGPQQ